MSNDDSTNNKDSQGSLHSIVPTPVLRLSSSRTRPAVPLWRALRDAYPAVATEVLQKARHVDLGDRESPSHLEQVVITLIRHALAEVQ